MSPTANLQIVSRTPWEKRLSYTLKKGHASLAVQVGAATDMRKADMGMISGEDVIRNAVHRMAEETAGREAHALLKEFLTVSERLNATEDADEAEQLEAVLGQMQDRLDFDRLNFRS